MLHTTGIVLFACAIGVILSAPSTTPTAAAPSVSAASANATLTEGGAHEASAEEVSTSGFSCEGRIFGYYGDTQNCSLFHYCEPFTDPEKNQFVLHAAYLCPNDTVFNQLSLTCTYPSEALPCARAPEYYYINSHVVPADQGSGEAKDGSSASSEEASSSTTAAPSSTTTKKP